jgi:hypothetical protein
MRSPRSWSAYEKGCRLHELAERQRAMLAVLKGRTAGAPSVGPRAEGPHLELLREIVFWWRDLGVTRYCSFTAKILRRRGDFGSVLAGFIRDCPGSALIEEQGDLFLDYVSRDPEPLVAALAATERALIRSRLDEARPETIIAWRHDPEAVFDFILNDVSFDEDEVAGSFVVRVTPGDSGLEWHAAPSR